MEDGFCFLKNFILVSLIDVTTDIVKLKLYFNNKLKGRLGLSMLPVVIHGFGPLNIYLKDGKLYT